MINKWILAPLRQKTLFWGFASQEIRARYAGSFGGVLWSVLTPLANLLIFVFVFSVVLKIRLKPVETGTDSFVLYLLSGLLPWTAFNESVSGSTVMFLNKANLITKVAFPLELVPVASILVTFFLNGIGFIIFLIYLAVEGYSHSIWLMIPIVTIILMVFTLGITILIASLSIFIRDIQHVIGLFMMLWMYITPILYPANMVPDKFKIYMVLNPLNAFVELYHGILLQHIVHINLLIQTSAFAAVSFLIGVWFYDKYRNAFADVI